MKKRFLAFGLALVMCLSMVAILASCDSGSDDNKRYGDRYRHRHRHGYR